MSGSAILTNNGLLKIASASPLDQLTITQIAIGDGVNPLDPNSIALVNEVYRDAASTPIRSTTYPNTLVFELNIPPTTGGFTCREIGAFDADGDLIAIGTLDELVKPTDGINYVARINVKLANAAQVDVFYDNQGAIDFEGLRNRNASALITGYPGSGFESDVQTVQNDVVSSELFGIGTGFSPTATQFADRLQAMIEKAGQDEFDIKIARGEFSANAPIFVDPTYAASLEAVSIKGAGNRRTKINYSGKGNFLNIQGTGDETGSPIKRLSLSDLWIFGNANTVSDGGLLIDRAYFIDLERMYVSGFAKSDAVAVKVTNVFNFEAKMFQFANGFPLPEGRSSFQVGSTGADAWTTSNVVLSNGAIQYGGNSNIEVVHDANSFDNFVVDNVTLGKSGLYSFLSESTNISNITLNNNHFESAGFNGDGNPLTAGSAHVKVSNALNLTLNDNSHQDAFTYIDIDSVRSFIANNGEYKETGFYDLTGNTLLKARTTSASINGQFNAQNIRTDQIDNLFDYVESGGRIIQIDNQWRTRVTESAWSSIVSPSPEAFQGKIINRYGSSNAPFDQMYSPDGANWGRMMYSTLYRGERNTNPDGLVTGQSGWFYLNTSGAVAGGAGEVYQVIGWKCVGGTSWKEMRTLTGE